MYSTFLVSSMQDNMDTVYAYYSFLPELLRKRKTLNYLLHCTNFSSSKPRLLKKSVSQDKTRKYLYSSNNCESVLFVHMMGSVLCLSGIVVLVSLCMHVFSVTKDQLKLHMVLILSCYCQTHQIKVEASK